MSEQPLPTAKPDDQPIEAGEVGRSRSCHSTRPSTGPRRRGRWPPVTEITLQEQGRARLEHVRQNGLLQYRPINPLLAWPKPLGWGRARRMRSDLNYILKLEGIDYRFEAFLY